MGRNVLVLFALMMLFSLVTAHVSSGEEWVLGDVIVLDFENNQLEISYIDYDNNAAEGMLINVDANTNYENVDSFSDIQIGDVVSIDYITCCGGKNTASNISVERIKKEEETE